jgi:predicted enzyme related to lactoylglutathione lyase
VTRQIVDGTPITSRENIFLLLTYGCHNRKLVLRLIKNREMNLVSTRIIATNVNELVKFYEQVTGMSVVQYTPDFAELQTEAATLAIGSTNTLQFFGEDEVAKAAQNRSAIIEFKVQDVDKEYERLAAYLEHHIVQKPTTMPWGNKSFLFRDPDGNLVNLFTPVTPKAMRKFAN